ncbi:hypothetical protein ACFW08_22155 [Streptomyces sp. NPDC058960]|uniref:hypothetical protein n=1 Tax=Streptomyces sp. NPDC058960 TaxID=3346679 RepID=UPI00368AE93A
MAGQEGAFRDALGPTLVPADTIPPRFAGAFLRPDPPLRRQLTGYTRTIPDPVTSSFPETLAEHAPLMPAHVAGCLRTADRAARRLTTGE